MVEQGQRTRWGDTSCDSDAIEESSGSGIVIQDSATVEIDNKFMEDDEKIFFVSSKENHEDLDGSEPAMRTLGSIEGGRVARAKGSFAGTAFKHCGQAIVSAVTSGSKRFFLGTDSAPHERRRKECPCGCAGIYNAPLALSLYAKVGTLDKLEAFISFNGPDFYGLLRNTSKIKLSKKPWKVPESYSFAYGDIVPVLAGETLDWLPYRVCCA
ncbi:hypothetical protein F0562_008128 [Nyssa sinensis]|uniref:Uncharacterized protein n=1 Tax=Nyssa sinensis TaxID=561372 RepID=A0A5J5A8N3_9ASTE|nr:hypothetical protein F0562_008128 [Nyssa sinensis]